MPNIQSPFHRTWQLDRQPPRDLFELPAIKWKQINLAKMADDKHKLAVDKLKLVLAL